MSAAASEWKVLDASGKVAASASLSRRAARNKALSAYAGATAGRGQANWEAYNRSADDTLLPERRMLIQRIRERLRNDPIMRGCLEKLVRSVIGPTGFNCQAQLDAERLGISDQQARDIERDIDFEWESWQSECDYSGNPARSHAFIDFLETWFEGEVKEGESLIIPRYVRRNWARYSFCLQTVCTDRIINPSNHRPVLRANTVINGRDIRDGIEIGARGEVVGIYIAKRHPNSFLYQYGDYETEFIPAINRKTGKANFWHNFQLYRAEATRGEPLFVASLLGFKGLGDYVSDELVRAHMATMFGLAVTREEAFDPDTEAVTDTDRYGTYEERQQAQIELFSGMVNYFEPGEKVDIVNPNIPGPGFEDFTDKLATWAGSPLGLSREQVLNTFNGMSFSSAKASRDEAQRGFKRWQQAIKRNYVEPPRERVIEEAYLRGWLKLPGFEDPSKRRLYFQHVCYPAPWPYLEPVKEENGVKLRLENGTSTLTLECAAKGHSFRKILQQRQREAQEIKAAGLPLPKYYQQEPSVPDQTSEAPTDSKSEDRSR